MAKIPIAVISGSRDHSRIAGFTCTNAINELEKKMKDSLKKVFLWNDGSSSQLCSKYVFVLMTHFVSQYSLSDTITRPTMEEVPWMVLAGQRVVFAMVKPNKITINTAEEFETRLSEVVPSI